jgi:hypothetical protein
MFHIISSVVYKRMVRVGTLLLIFGLILVGIAIAILLFYRHRGVPWWAYLLLVLGILVFIIGIFTAFASESAERATDLLNSPAGQQLLPLLLV